jgi:hypothetical protein
MAGVKSVPSISATSSKKKGIIVSKFNGLKQKHLAVNFRKFWNENPLKRTPSAAK